MSANGTWRSPSLRVASCACRRVCLSCASLASRGCGVVERVWGERCSSGGLLCSGLFWSVLVWSGLVWSWEREGCRVGDFELAVEPLLRPMRSASGLLRRASREAWAQGTGHYTILYNTSIPYYTGHWRAVACVGHWRAVACVGHWRAVACVGAPPPPRLAPGSPGRTVVKFFSHASDTHWITILTTRLGWQRGEWG